MKTLNNRILENLIWIRENLIANKKDTTKIDAQIEQKRKEIEDNAEVMGCATEKGKSDERIL